MEENLWMMEQRSRELQEYRLDIQEDWIDEVAKNLNSQYLNPHESDDAVMLQSLRNQNEYLEIANNELIIAHRHASDAEQFSVEVKHFLELTQEEVNHSRSEYSQYVESQAAAQSEFPKILKLVEKANRACRTIDF